MPVHAHFGCLITFILERPVFSNFVVFSESLLTFVNMGYMSTQQGELSILWKNSSLSFFSLVIGKPWYSSSMSRSIAENVWA
ncbi:hypothetical protein FB446DRAFT_758155 [Lentinula raphanica]|nr:hypothetical protein FB446DRAFT_758155 [Lentinula raphanica]